MEIALHEWNYAWVAGSFLILSEGFQHHHIGPPVFIRLRPNRAVRPLMGQRPFHPLLGLGDQLGIAQEVGQGNQPVRIIWATLPALSGPAQPAAFRTDVFPKSSQMPG